MSPLCAIPETHTWALAMSSLTKRTLELHGPCELQFLLQNIDLTSGRRFAEIHAHVAQVGSKIGVLSVAAVLVVDGASNRG
jgi:hypothetical protein